MKLLLHEIIKNQKDKQAFIKITLFCQRLIIIIIEAREWGEKKYMSHHCSKVSKRQNEYEQQQKNDYDN